MTGEKQIQQIKADIIAAAQILIIGAYAKPLATSAPEYPKLSFLSLRLSRV